MTTDLKTAPVPIAASISASDNHLRTTGIVELPSRGKLYSDKCPTGLVELFPITGREEALVAGMTASNVSEIFDIILKRCMKSDPNPALVLSVDEMLSSDKFYLMLVLRANSYGSHYEFTTKCPDCGARVDASCEIPEDFELKMAPDDFREPFTIMLPRLKVNVEFRLLRGKDDADIIRYTRRETSKAHGLEAGDPAFIYRMAKHVLSVDGKPYEISAALRFIENLIGEDISTLKEAVEETTPGVITALDLECQAPRCGNYFKADMPFSASFFRANKRGKGKSV